MITYEHPLRHPLQALVSLGQIYGDVLYYATSMFDLYFKSLAYCRPEAYYFWGYYFSMNFIWIVIPGSKWHSSKSLNDANCVSTVLLYSSIVQSAKAFKALDRQTKSQVGYGHVKKFN